MCSATKRFVRCTRSAIWLLPITILNDLFSCRHMCDIDQWSDDITLLALMYIRVLLFLLNNYSTCSHLPVSCRVTGSIDIRRGRPQCLSERLMPSPSRHETSYPQRRGSDCHELNIHWIRRRFLFTHAELVTIHGRCPYLSWVSSALYSHRAANRRWVSSDRTHGPFLPDLPVSFSARFNPTMWAKKLHRFIFAVTSSDRARFW